MSCRDGRLRDIVSVRAGWRLWPAVIRTRSAAASRPSRRARRIADGLSDLMDHFAGDEPDRVAKDDLSKDIEDLRAAVGLEEEL